MLSDDDGCCANLAPANPPATAAPTAAAGTAELTGKPNAKPLLSLAAGASVVDLAPPVAGASLRNALREDCFDIFCVVVDVDEVDEEADDDTDADADADASPASWGKGGDRSPNDERGDTYSSSSFSSSSISDSASV